MRRALLTAVRDQLRLAANAGGLALAKTECELAPRSGKPPAVMGERFVGIWAGDRSSLPVTLGLDEVYSVNVTVTYRTSRVPPDRTGPNLTEAAGAFDDLVDAVRLCLALDVADGRISGATGLANVALGFTGDNTSPAPFYTPLVFLGDGGNEDCGASWFSAEGDEEPEGVKCTLRFGKVRRTQDFGDVRALS
jgi:hypothetical protein